MSDAILLGKRVEIAGLGPAVLMPGLRYDYYDARSTCPLCGGLMWPWAGWATCEAAPTSSAHVALVGTGEVFVRLPGPALPRGTFAE